MDGFVWDSRLYHHGTKGMHWGIRRYQNEDGTLTEAGKKRYYVRGKEGQLSKRGQKRLVKEYSKDRILDIGGKKHREAVGKFVKSLAENDPKYQKAYQKYSSSFNHDKKIMLNRTKKQEKMMREGEAAVKKILGKPGQQLMYKDERASFVYKQIVENELIPAIMREVNNKK